MTETSQTKKAKDVADTTSMPAYVVRKGAIAASIWGRQSPSGYRYYDFSLSRSYKSMSSGKEGYSTNFFDRNKEDLKEVIEKATAWIIEHTDKTAAAEAA